MEVDTSPYDAGPSPHLVKAEQSEALCVEQEQQGKVSLKLVPYIPRSRYGRESGRLGR